MKELLSITKELIDDLYYDVIKKCDPIYIMGVIMILMVGFLVMVQIGMA